MCVWERILVNPDLATYLANICRPNLLHRCVPSLYEQHIPFQQAAHKNPHHCCCMNIWAVTSVQKCILQTQLPGASHNKDGVASAPCTGMVRMGTGTDLVLCNGCELGNCWSSPMPGGPKHGKEIIRNAQMQQNCHQRMMAYCHEQPPIVKRQLSHGSGWKLCLKTQRHLFQLAVFFSLEVSKIIKYLEFELIWKWLEKHSAGILKSSVPSAEMS